MPLDRKPLEIDPAEIAQLHWSFRNRWPESGRDDIVLNEGLKRLLGQLHRVGTRRRPSVCLHPDGCDRKAIRSHEISRRGSLACLAQNGHLVRLALPFNLRDFPRALQPDQIGVGKASTFSGLCDHHDNLLFAQLDADQIPDTRTSGLVAAARSIYASYGRALDFAFLYERLMDLAENVPSASNELRAFLSDLHVQANLEAEGALLALRSWPCTGSRGAFPESYFHVLAYRVPNLGFAASGFWDVRYDLNGHPVGRSNYLEPPQHVAFSVLPDVNGAFVSLVCARGEKSPVDGILRPLIHDVFCTVEERIWELALRYCGTLVFNPTVWSAKTAEWREAVVQFSTQRLLSGHPMWPNIALPVPI